MKARNMLILLVLLIASVSVMAGCSGKRGAAALETVTILYPGNEAIA